MTNEKDTNLPELVLEDEITESVLEEIALPILTLPEDELLDLESIEGVKKASEIDPMPERDLEENLTKEELAIVDDFSQKIDITNSSHILQYGAGSQQKMVAFSESALSTIQSKDLGEVGSMITGLVTEIKEFNPEQEEKGGLFKLFRKPAKKFEQLKVQYDTVEKNVDKISGELETHKRTLIKDITMLDKMYDMNLDYYKELTLYIIAGRKKLDQVRTVDLPALQAKAKETGQPQDAQLANDLANQINRFDKKLHDLDLTRNISIQMGPQIRMVQGNDAMMVEKIQSSIVNTIPLWKNQIVLSLGLHHTKLATDVQREVTDVTNKMLKSNAEALKTGTIEAAKESERGIVDIETLQETNQSLIETLDEVLKIQQEGYQKRRAAEGELLRIENELKSKLLEARDASTEVSNESAAKQD